MNKKILDIKSKKELDKHKNNFYLSEIKGRKKISISNKFEIDNKNDYFLVNIKKFSSFAGSYYFNGNDPLVNTALEYLKNQNKKLEDSYLYNFYERFQPKTYGELYDLKNENKLHKIPSTSFFHPWIHTKPTNVYRCGLFGPKHITNVEHRITRIKNLINNIKMYDYIPSKNDMIEGYILLKKNKDYRFLITGGHHRVAVLTALYMNDNNKYENIPVKYDNVRVNVKIVKENDVENWPGVKSKWLKKEDALEMFYKYFK
jgi:hypothetical protein